MVHSFTIIFGVTFAVTHVIAEWLRLYWHYAWLDMPMHVMGGIVIMLMFASLRLMWSPLQRLSRRPVAILFSAVLLCWEGFGIYRYGGIKPDFWGDTILDLICGVGGIVGGYLLVQGLEQIDKLARKDNE